ncbi:hypothetical protein TRIUR3_34667 [Triticum urartu]|uniref:Uncharacterized protein n=1 Tax=Triticum urartu TaxID=4572 RepID=M8AJS6_TRIUA|nr:hypothetical protein TRIUR3_34667 [Triticum urartu]
MGRKVCISLVILALVLLAGSNTRAAAGYSKGEALMPSSSSSMKLEDGVAPELGVMTVVNLDVHSRLLGGNNVAPRSLDPNRPVCLVTPLSSCFR